MLDPLSIPGIASRQQQIEGALQGIPDEQRKLDRLVVEAEIAMNKAKASAHAILTVSGGKMLAAERDLKVAEICEAQILDFEYAKVEADYGRNAAKQLNNELMSLASRAKSALAQEQAHQRFGEN